MWPTKSSALCKEEVRDEAPPRQFSFHCLRYWNISLSSPFPLPDEVRKCLYCGRERKDDDATCPGCGASDTACVAPTIVVIEPQ